MNDDNKSDGSSTAFWVKQFQPRTQKWRRETLSRLSKSKNPLETEEQRQAKMQALKQLESKAQAAEIVDKLLSEVRFGTLNPDGSLSNEREIPQSAMQKCPHFIMDPSHYREDGTCKCNDPEHQKMMIKDWGYSKKDFKKPTKESQEDGSLKTATFIKVLSGRNGVAHLYELSAPLAGNKYVVVSAVPAAFDTGCPETFIFAALASGEVKNYRELEGSYRGGMDHARALENAGYVVEEDEKKKYECPSCETVFTGRKWSPARRSACPTCRSNAPFKELKPTKESQEIIDGLLSENPETDTVDCPACGGELTSLGSLGRRQHFRCRDCGMDSSKESHGGGWTQRRKPDLRASGESPEGGPKPGTGDYVNY